MSSKNTINYELVFKVFKNNYELVPLELFKHPYEILISTVLSARTKDELTLKICQNLFKIAPNFKQLSTLEETEIEKLIFPVGFYKTKAKHIKKLAADILTLYDGIVPKERNKLIALPGVGQKTANLVLNRAFKIPAIAVDTHVHRITNLLKWVETSSPEETEKQLTKVLPKKYWSDCNRLFVSIGRKYKSKQKLNKFLEDNNLI